MTIFMTELDVKHTLKEWYGDAMFAIENKRGGDDGFPDSLVAIGGVLIPIEHKLGRMVEHNHIQPLPRALRVSYKLKQPRIAYRLDQVEIQNFTIAGICRTERLVIWRTPQAMAGTPEVCYVNDFLDVFKFVQWDRKGSINLKFLEVPLEITIDKYKADTDEELIA